MTEIVVEIPGLASRLPAHHLPAILIRALWPETRQEGWSSLEKRIGVEMGKDWASGVLNLRSRMSGLPISRPTSLEMCVIFPSDLRLYLQGLGIALVETGKPVEDGGTSQLAE